jgi:hypothetical protein
MHVAVRRNRLNGRRKRLAEDLPAEHGAPAEILALPAKEVCLDAFESEQLNQFVEDVHLHLSL